MKEFKLYYEQHKPELIEELFSLLRIPSISAVKDNHKDIVACAELWCKLLTNAGVDKAEVLPSKGNPVVYAERIVDKKLPTVLVYGHYDVMPAEPLELWETNPFEPVIKEGAIWGRGADDDKGQSFMHYIVFKYLNSTGKLNCNVKFLLEGEEEIGSPSLTDFCNKHKAKLAADIILVSDTSMLSADMPSITTGLRGLAYWQIEVTGPNRDLHSGIFGGAVANPINELCKLIAKLQDADGKITIPGFYDDVEELSAEEKKLVDKIPFNETEYKQALDVEQLYGEKGYNTIERTGNRPSLDVCGIWGGYTGEGAKTVLPSKAYAKLSTRLVPNQRYHKMSEAVINHINSIAPAHVSVQVKPLHGAESYVCPITLPAYKATEKAYEKVFGVRPLPVRRGGSIGVIAIFEEVLGIKSILMGFGLESDAIHSPNENYQIEMFEKGMQTIFEFYQIYGK